MRANINVKKICFLVNPLKNAANIKSYYEWVLGEITHQRPDWSVDLFHKIWPSDLQNFDLVWVMGGDGTFNYFVNQYPTCSIPIGLFEGGTGNDFYWKVFGKISKKEHLDHILDGNIKSFDAGQVNDMIFLNGVGIGIEGDVLKSMQAIRFIGGALGYYLAAIPQLFKFKSYEITFDRGGKTIVKKVFLCMIFNSSRAGGGFHFFPMASIQDGLLDMMLCNPIAVIKRLFYMPLIQKGMHVHYPFLEFSTIQSTKIQCNRVLSAAVDGEILEANAFDFKILPAKFKYIVPLSQP
jgi:YegS/Rv2252/BmrU family lipid kinase